MGRFNEEERRLARMLYLYALVPSSEVEVEPVPTMKGFDGEHDIYALDIQGITAIVCGLPDEEYSESVLQDKIENDMEWLQDKAFHHHETVLMMSQRYTIIPLKFCTIYKHEDSLKDKVGKHLSSLKDAFTDLEGKEEWNVKIYCDDKRLKETISHPSITEKWEEIKQLPKGRQFFEKKKMEQLENKVIENEKNRMCEEFHERLKSYATEGTVKKNWGKDVTGRAEQMAWNSVYFLPKEGVDRFVDEIKQSESKWKEAGWTFEATGPWPPYHFSSFS
ncbi:GvpL/GvpF family gas vesicle protein [Rossellomorea marisflavi]|uniref:GvpL/GvpF family gas vesicle protein n=2 Tax=Rossellomorea marisflavi TaxID=189381 RepID=A0A5D4RKR4_9BACI|nr:GvpL/GvpF family gas vesicle protein [Rossellomorea marisflavi]